LLRELGHEVSVANARKVWLIGESRKKDDRSGPSSYHFAGTVGSAIVAGMVAISLCLSKDASSKRRVVAVD